MKKIAIIGNNASNLSINDGGRLKIRLYSNLLKKEGYDVDIIDLNKWKFHIFKTIRKIRKSIKNKEKIIVMAGPNGCRYIIPIVNYLNRKRESTIVFCPLGVGTIDFLLKKLDPLKVNDFITCKNFNGIRDEKMGKILSDFQYIVVQNESLKHCYEKFYNLSNVVVLKNFRYFPNETYKFTNINNTLKMVYYSRVCENKGIFDLIKAINEIDSSISTNISLDIYGDIQCDDKNDFLGKQTKNIKYCGIIKQEDSVKMLSNYDLFVLPTKYHGEGTPGSLIESFIAGTPVLVSSYSQAKDLIKEGFNGFIFKINDVESLKSKIIEISKMIGIVRSMRKNVLDFSKIFLYESNKNDFLNYLG